MERVSRVDNKSNHLGIAGGSATSCRAAHSPGVMVVTHEKSRMSSPDVTLLIPAVL